MSYFIAFGAVVASYAVGVSLVKKDCNAKCQNKIASETKQLRLENQELIKRINELQTQTHNLEEKLDECHSNQK
jgi:uncharacterized protein YlxW (UPF0749 family)